MYSRRYKVEEKRNARRAIVFVILTIIASVLLLIYGIPVAAKFATFLVNLRNQSSSQVVSDSTPPPPPRFDTLPQTTKDANLEVRGNTEAGATVTINFNESNIDVISNNDGNFSHEFTLKKGENSFWATAQDTSGNESVKTSIYKITLDLEPPSLDVTKPADGSEFTGSRQRQMVLEGKTNADAKLQINDRLAIVSTDGSFTYVTTLNDGTNTFTITAEDAAGNKTEKTVTIQFSP
jgi:hypothetical protein